MRIGAAQVRSVVGDVDANVERHVQLLESEAASAADVVVFPELSLTAYEPRLAESLTIEPDDERLAPLQRASVDLGVTVGVGAPTRHGDAVRISLIWFLPDGSRAVYSKQHLHEDETPFFAPGPPDAGLVPGWPSVALAICYELSVPKHAAAACEAGATTYVASVAKTASGVRVSESRFGEIAREHNMAVLMANAIGTADGSVCAGGSGAWDATGRLVEPLGPEDEGLIVFDTETRRATRTVL